MVIVFYSDRFYRCVTAEGQNGGHNLSAALNIVCVHGTGLGYNIVGDFSMNICII